MRLISLRLENFKSFRKLTTFTFPEGAGLFELPIHGVRIACDDAGLVITRRFEERFALVDPHRRAAGQLRHS